MDCINSFASISSPNIDTRVTGTSISISLVISTNATETGSIILSKKTFLFVITFSFTPITEMFNTSSPKIIASILISETHIKDSIWTSLINSNYFSIFDVVNSYVMVVMLISGSNKFAVFRNCTSRYCS